MSSTPQDLSLRKSDSFYDNADIEVMKNTEVMKIDSTKNAVVTQSGEVFNYNYLVLATGGTPRTLDIANGISNIFLLRTPEDGNAIGILAVFINVKSKQGEKLILFKWSTLMIIFSCVKFCFSQCCKSKKCGYYWSIIYWYGGSCSSI